MPGQACCSGGTRWRQARSCKTDEFANVWMTTVDAATLPGAFRLTGIFGPGLCLYFNFSDTTYDTFGGIIYSATTATNLEDCDVCCPDAVYDNPTSVSLNLPTSIAIAGCGDPISSGGGTCETTLTNIILYFPGDLPFGEFLYSPKCPGPGDDGVIFGSVCLADWCFIFFECADIPGDLHITSLQLNVAGEDVPDGENIDFPEADYTCGGYYEFSFTVTKCGEGDPTIRAFTLSYIKPYTFYDTSILGDYTLWKVYENKVDFGGNLFTVPCPETIVSPAFLTLS